MKQHKLIVSSWRCWSRHKRQPSGFPHSCRHAKKKLLLSDCRPQCCVPRKLLTILLLQIRKKETWKRPNLMNRVIHKSNGKINSNCPSLILSNHLISRDNPCKRLQNLHQDKGSRIQSRSSRSCRINQREAVKFLTRKKEYRSWTLCSRGYSKTNRLGNPLWQLLNPLNATLVISHFKRVLAK